MAKESQELSLINSQVPAIRQEPTVMEVIQALAVDERVSVEKLAGLMQLQERVEARNAEKEFNIDLAAAMAEMPTIRKDGIKGMGAGKTGIPYATYEHIDKIIRPIEKRHGFCRIFTTAPLEKPGSLMTCMLLHKGGHSISSTRFHPPDPGPGRTGIQEIGSADSYARRYLTLAIWNIVTVGSDDDGDGTDLVNEQQLSTITDMVNACELNGAALSAFLKFANAPSIDKIKWRDYERVIQALRQKQAAVRR
jgi:hypothetical protein